MKRQRHRSMNLWTISIRSIALYECARTSMGHPNGARCSFVDAFQQPRHSTVLPWRGFRPSSMRCRSFARVQTFQLFSTSPSKDAVRTHPEEAIQGLAGDEALSSCSSSTGSSGPLSLTIDELSSALGGRLAERVPRGIDIGLGSTRSYSTIPKLKNQTLMLLFGQHSGA